jgi:peptide-methionine (S)-S-oxide reductase
VTTTETATLAGGCFWCVEAAFKQLDGVESVESGYTGGYVEDPSYEAGTSKTPATRRSVARRRATPRRCR